MIKTQSNFARTRHTCYFSYLSMASTFALPPVLFLTFRELYGISYTLLGTLVLINFCTQLTIDLVFTFFSKYFNIKATVRIMPVLTALGLSVYAVVPAVAPDMAYAGLVVGTVIFSVAAGLSEVLLSPLVAAIPSKDPKRDMSMLHSLYAWGVLSVVTLSTLFLQIFGNEKWMYLTLFWAVLPIVTCVMFCLSPMPEMNLSHSQSGGRASRRGFGLALCVVCIFLGGAAENVMTNWVSSYMETALKIPKAAGDILGMALFALLLGFGRILFAKYGKKIYNVMLLGMAGAAVCYIVAALSPSGIVAMIACTATGFCASMLWPGNLIYMEEKFPGAGVTAYALMAAGGDLGSSVAPQMLGGIVDAVAATDFAEGLAERMSVSVEQIGMKAGMLAASVFPILGVIVILSMGRYFKKKNI